MKLVPFTYSSDLDHPGLARLKRSLVRWGWPTLRVYGGEGRWMGHAHKLTVAKGVLPLLAADGATHVVFMDAWDTVCCGPIDPVEDMAKRGGITLSAEIECWPMPERAEDFPPVQSRWKYLNAGGYVAEAEYLEMVLDGFDANGCPMGCDQAWFTERYLRSYQHSLMKLDYSCEVFQTMAKCEQDYGAYFDTLPNGRMWNREMQTQPVLWHGNSRVSMQFLRGGELSPQG